MELNIKKLSIILVIVFLVLAFNLNVEAIEIENNSSYSLRGSLGSNMSNFNHLFRLNYTIETDDFSLQTRANFLKEFQANYGKYRKEDGLIIVNPDTWSITPNWYFNLDEEDLRTLNYNLKLTYSNKIIEYGDISIPSGSLMPGGSMLGGYLESGNLKVWYGDTEGSDNPLVGDRAGVKYQSGDRESSYQYRQNNDVGDSHYFSYADIQKVNTGELNYSLGLRGNPEESIYGSAIRTRYADQFRDVNYNITGFYRDSNFEKVSGGSSSEMKHTSFRMYKQLSDRLLLDYGNSYRSTDRRRSINNNVRFNYYGDTLYRFDLRQRLSLRYDDNEWARNRENYIFEINNERSSVDYQTGLEVTKNKLQDKNDEYNLYLGLSNLEVASVDLRSRYDFQMDDTDLKYHTLSFNAKYERELFDRIDYNLGYDLSVSNQDSTNHEINQRFRLDRAISKNQNLVTVFNSTYYPTRSYFSNDLNFNYNYRF
ncbi:hypothetical protein [Natroniella sp. ANB-PHB2]|uniref:hypothetical protein n=1 Tax=Natroniella sp. ANB-PHB2 TaxID=3384444 RepID=UPI0038D3F63F